jgi:2-oxoglutarate-Fe(II)-dependent oxygenase superfamily protein
VPDDLFGIARKCVTISEKLEEPPSVAVDLENLEEQLPRLRETYASAQPFPHIVLDNFLTPEVARRAAQEFPSVDHDNWISFMHVNERKFSHPEVQDWGPTLQSVAAELNSPAFVGFLSELTGIEHMIIDESMEGGGLHQSLQGGFLNIHADFTVHPLHANWRRRVNLLLYFNEEWDPEYGGELELWSTDMRKRVHVIAPIQNRCVIFTTDPDSFHGHPEPLRCPPERARRSLALYYFTVEDHPLVRSTEYRARPGDGKRSALIYLDKQVLRAYDRVKRCLGISDRRASGWLRPLTWIFRPRSKSR